MESDKHFPQGSFVSSPLPSERRRLSRKAWLFIAGVAALVAVGAAVWFVMARSNNTTADILAKQNAGPAVHITMQGPNPASIRVKAGQEVTFVNQDTRQHQLTADQSVLDGFDSVEPLNQGDSYTFAFDSTGTFRYYDPADPQTFNGTIIVEK